MQLTKIFQSRDILVLDKPPGLSVHNAGPSETDLLEQVKLQFDVQAAFPVHRLDKETSGVQLIALHDESARYWANEFQSHRLKKIYRAIVRGVLQRPDGVWNLPLTDKAEGRANPQGQASLRVPCETRYHVQTQNKYFSLLEIDLRTGRQHQIRKHSALDRHAVVGDERYGDKAYNSKMAELYKTDRLFLHCSQLSIENTLFEAPIPQEFDRLMV